MTGREQFIAWLNDARSTELAQIPVLQNHADDARDYPEIRERDLQHLEETRRQAEQLEMLITDLGGSISTVKTAIGKITGFGHSISTEIFPDELIKNFLADYAAEHFEIASYISLIATAELIGEQQCIPVLENILSEEVAMARWLEQNISMATAESLKITTGDNYDGRTDGSRRRTGRKTLSRRIAKPSVLTALLGIGAATAGAALLMRSKNKSAKRDFAPNKQSALNQNSSNQFEQSDLMALPEEVTVVETVVIAVEEPSDNLNANAARNAATGNS